MKPSRFRNDISAVSPIISAILLLTIMLITVGSIMAWAIPRIQQMEYDAQYDGTFSNFEVFDSRADDVIYGGSDESRTAGFSFGGGDLILARDNGYMFLYWSLVEDNITFSGVNSEDGEFSFIFDRMDGDNLSANITGTGGQGGFTSTAGSEDHNYASDAVMGKVTPGFKFGDLQHIRIHNSTSDLAEAYYFRMKVLEHNLPTSSGYYEIKWMNGAIITNRGSKIGSVSDIPYVYPRGDSLYINIIDLSTNRSGFISAGWGSYHINIKNLQTTLISFKQVYSFQMSIHTEYAGGWNFYYDTYRNFSSVKDADYKTIGLSYRYGEFTNLKLVMTDLELTGVR